MFRPLGTTMLLKADQQLSSCPPHPVVKHIRVSENSVPDSRLVAEPV